MSFDDSAGRSASPRVFWFTVAFLAGLLLFLFFAEDSLNPLMTLVLGAAAALGYGTGASDAVVGVVLGFISACAFFAITGVAFAVGYLLLSRRFPDSNIGTGLTVLLVIAAGRLIGIAPLDQALAGVPARIAHVTESVVLIAVFGTFIVVTWRPDKLLRPKEVVPAPAWDPFDVQDDCES